MEKRKGCVHAFPYGFVALHVVRTNEPAENKCVFQSQIHPAGANWRVNVRGVTCGAAYSRAIQQFLAWVERTGYQHLEDIEPITVAAYIETLQRQAAPLKRRLKQAGLPLVGRTIKAANASRKEL